MKNKLTDLNNHLFAQLERLGNEDLKDGDLAMEITRSRAIAIIAREAIANARLVLDAATAIEEHKITTPSLFGIDNK
jgi:hypothetical protein